MSEAEPIDRSLPSAIASETRRLIDERTMADALGSFGAVAVISLAAYSHAAHGGILQWALGISVLLMVQLAYPRLLSGLGDAAFFRCHVAMGIALGVGWAACAILVRPDEFAYEAFVVLALCVVFTAGSVYNAHHPPVLYGFLGVGMGSLAVVYALRGGTLNWGISAGFAILMWTLIGYGLAFQRGFVRTIELGFENARLVDELTTKTRALEHANAAKTRFLAAASHDLRQPLHAMSLLVGLLAERARGAGLDELVGRIGQSSQAMETLLNAILDVSRLDAGIEHPDRRDWPLRQLLDRIEARFVPIAAARGLSLRVRASNAWVRTDGPMLDRILDNLVGNALRYTGAGGVLVAARSRGNSVSLEVWDTGIGIPPDRLEDVFDEFVQLHNPERDRNKGLGLGLSIVRRTADLLGHRIELASRPGRGTVFKVHLPRGTPPLPGNEVLLDEDEVSVSGLTVLVVDDEPAIRYALHGLLSAWGCDCVAAAGADEAEASLGQGGRIPDAILCDYRFAGGTGVEVIARLRSAVKAPIPALIVTGDVTADRLLDIAWHQLPVIHKPVNPAQLRRWLGQVRTQTGA